MTTGRPETFTTYDGRELPIPPFADNTVIQSTANFEVVYGYKAGLEPGPEAERTFIVAQTDTAGAVLADAARRHGAALDSISRPGEKGQPGKFHTAIRYRGFVANLMQHLNGEGISRNDGYLLPGSGVESLSDLEAAVKMRQQALIQNS